jgi:membrane protein DedA with SNARE-associated domain
VPFVVLAAILSIPANVGYIAVFGLIAIETMGVPVPGETALIAAGLAAHDGHLSIELVIVLAAVAAILGDNVGFAIGRRFGRRIFERPGIAYEQRLALLELGEPFFERHGPKAVFLGRWVAGLRIAAAWLAGINRMPWRRFLFWNALGGVGWATSVGLLAYYLGPPAERIFRTAGIAGGSLVGVALLAFVLWQRLRRDAGHGGRR